VAETLQKQDERRNTNRMKEGTQTGYKDNTGWEG
jgi:hypothetical protein